MSVRGWVKGCKLVNQGSELTADVSIGDTVLPVDWTGDFDDTGGTLVLNGTPLDYTSVDTTVETVTLAAALAVGAAEGDRVDVMTGGQVLKDYTLFVSLGDGDDAEVDIPFGDRDAWPEGDYDNPVEVLLSDDLERIESVPGVLPVRRIIGGYIATSDDESAARIVLLDDALQGIIQFFTGLDDETPGFINPGVTGGGQPFITMQVPTTPSYPGSPFFQLLAGSPSSAGLTASVIGLVCNNLNIAGQMALDPSNTTGSGANAYIDPSTGQVRRVTSSLRYKQDVENADIDTAAVLALVPRRFRRKDEVATLGDEAPWYVGFIAEEAAAAGMDVFVRSDDDGPESFDYPMHAAVGHQAVLREMRAEIDALKADLADLRGP